MRGAAEDDLDGARAEEYLLLARLLLHPPEAMLLEKIARLSGDASELGRAHAALAEAAARSSVDSVRQEHFTLFSGLSRGELLPYASYYLTGFVQGRPLADIRETLRALGIERSQGQMEPEDHAAILLEIMAGLASGELASPAGTDRRFFESHLASWIGRFFFDLERCKTARFYVAVGSLGRTFIDIEGRGFALLATHA